MVLAYSQRGLLYTNNLDNKVLGAFYYTVMYSYLDQSISHISTLDLINRLIKSTFKGSSVCFSFNLYYGELLNVYF